MTARAWLGVVLAIAASALGAASWLRCEGESPVITGPAQLYVGRSDTPVAVEASDARSGIRSLELRIAQGSVDQQLATSEIPGSLVTGGARDATQRIEAVVNAETLGLHEGDARLIAKAQDWSWRNWFRGGVTTLEIPVTVDLTKPRIVVETGQTYVQRGGAGAVVYSVREATRRDGVQVGDAFFAGRPFPGDPKRRIALFAIPRDVALNPRIAVIAVDLAGNEAAATWPVALEERVFDDVRIDLSNSFLEVKVRELAENVGVKEPDALAAFQEINSEIRAENEKKIRELIAKSSDEPLFARRLPADDELAGDEPLRRAAQLLRRRASKVSEAIHYGYDLASLGGRSITASNRGRVLLRGRPRHLRQLRAPRPRARARHALRPSLAASTCKAGDTRREGPDARALRRDRPRGRRSPALRHAGRRRLRGSGRSGGTRSGSRARRCAAEQRGGDAAHPRPPRARSARGAARLVSRASAATCPGAARATRTRSGSPRRCCSRRASRR